MIYIYYLFFKEHFGDTWHVMSCCYFNYLNKTFNPTMWNFKIPCVWVHSASPDLAYISHSFFYYIYNKDKIFEDMSIGTYLPKSNS
jgi:hypothetical protein